MSSSAKYMNEHRDEFAEWKKEGLIDQYGFSLDQKIQFWLKDMDTVDRVMQRIPPEIAPSVECHVEDTVVHFG